MSYLRHTVLPAILLALTFNASAASFPNPILQWQLQSSGDYASSPEADVYDLDFQNLAASDLSLLKQRNAMLVCTISAGTWQEWRPDADQFPDDILGNDAAGWEGEKWLDIRATDSLTPILDARMQQCANQGYQGVELTNLDVYQQDSGFPVTQADQISFNLHLARLAHQHHLLVGMRDSPQLVGILVDDFDFAVAQGCYSGNGCDAYTQFASQNKPVVLVEFADSEVNPEELCQYAQSNKFSAVIKHRNFDQFSQFCPTPSAN